MNGRIQALLRCPYGNLHGINSTLGVTISERKSRYNSITSFGSARSGCARSVNKEQLDLVLRAILSLPEDVKIWGSERVKTNDMARNRDLAIQFDKMMQLKDGWFEGEGIVPNAEKLKSFAAKMIENYPESHASPHIVPTQDGNLLFEWDMEGHPSIDIDLKNMNAYFHTFGVDGKEMEKSFMLVTESDFKTFFDFLSSYMQLTT